MNMCIDSNGGRESSVFIKLSVIVVMLYLRMKMLMIYIWNVMNMMMKLVTVNSVTSSVNYCQRIIKNMKK